MTTTRFSGPLAAKGQRLQVVQGEAELDLTDDTDTTKLLKQVDDIPLNEGADNVIIKAIHGDITTTVAADSTEPVVTIQDDSGNSTGATITISDGDADGDFVTSSVSDGTAITPVDLTSEDLEAAVTTAAADSGTAAGTVKVLVEALLVK